MTRKPTRARGARLYSIEESAKRLAPAAIPPAGPAAPIELRPVGNATVDHRAHPYEGQELAPPMRPGAMDAFAWPSRAGDRLYYRDGRVEGVQ